VHLFICLSSPSVCFSVWQTCLNVYLPVYQSNNYSCVFCSVVSKRRGSGKRKRAKKPLQAGAAGDTQEQKIPASDSEDSWNSGFLPNSSRDELASVYISNLDMAIDRHELYCELLNGLEALVDVSLFLPPPSHCS